MAGGRVGVGAGVDLGLVGAVGLAVGVGVAVGDVVADGAAADAPAAPGVIATTVAAALCDGATVPTADDAAAGTDGGVDGVPVAPHAAARTATIGPITHPPRRRIRDLLPVHAPGQGADGEHRHDGPA